MSVGKTSDNGTISVFTKTGITVFKEEDVLITCKGKPILIGMRDGRGRYQIPLMQQWEQWQPPRLSSKQAWKALRQANSVYDLPSTEQAIKWMHARRMWIPGKIDLAQSHKSRQLHGLADANGTQHPKVLPQSNRDS